MNAVRGPLLFSSLPGLLNTRFCNIPPASAGLLLLLALILSPQHAFAAPQSTTTALAVTPGGNPVTIVSQGTVVTLTATVTAGGTSVTPGTVSFCDTAALSCADIHLVGNAQLTSAGIATVRFRATAGTHSYKAVFAGTSSYAASSSAASSVAMLQPISMTLTSSGTAGSYALSGTVVVPAGLPPPAPSASRTSPTATTFLAPTRRGRRLSI
jgi:hypothetical protein